MTTTAILARLAGVGSLDEARAITAECADPWEVREEWLTEIGWERPHGSYCACLGCDPFNHSDSSYMYFGADVEFGFMAVVDGIRRDGAVWDAKAGVAVVPDIHADRPMVGVAA